ncbi:LysR family transcriptional regulator [Acinetobacter cumulans]|uniref:LysR family transcriptional regulator n=1 Tax=Acinetobacter cumulans TaxID=2136182 RepID=A0A3A8GJ94_9GAMM|nr:LysR substrate-binding domain-containing protein [Acinetobacter cumulans]RKG53921.1 LysR family transcriptional regulator [Acinetobacter cumulans]
MIDLNSLQLFYVVVSAGGYSAAHRKTGQSRATLSRHIITLEEHLAVRLIERSTRSFRLTEQGQILYTHCQELFAQLDTALMQVETLQHEPQGLVRIAIPPSLLSFHQLGQEILRYMDSYPQVKVQIEVSNRAVDVHHENVDFVIRARTSLDYPLDYVPVLLARMNLVMVVHPKWQNMLSASIDETISQVPCIAWQANGEFAYWSLRHQDTGEVAQHKIRPRLIVDDLSMLREAALNGLGMVMIPHIYVQDDLSLGRLVQVQSIEQPIMSMVHAVHLGNRGMRPAVRHLLDWLKEITISLR